MRYGVTVLLTAALALGAGSQAAAQTKEAPERFTFDIPNAPESTLDGDRFQLVVHRWSTDEERDKVISTIKEQGAKALLTAFRETGGIAYLRWPGGLEYTVRYARRTTRPDGGSDIILVADRPVWIWWDQKAAAGSPTDTPYTVITLQLDKAGQGKGIVMNTTDVTADATAGLKAPADTSKAFVLNDVRREARTS